MFKSKAKSKSSLTFKSKSKSAPLKMVKSKSKSKSDLLQNCQIQIREFKSISTNPDLKIRWASAKVELHFGGAGFVDLKFSNPNPAMFKSKSSPPEKAQIQIHCTKKGQIQPNSKSTGFDKSCYIRIL